MKHVVKYFTLSMGYVYNEKYPTGNQRDINFCCAPDRDTNNEKIRFV